MKNMFFTNHFLMLQVIDKYQIKIQNESFSPITQAELAEILDISVTTANRMFKELVQEGYVQSYNNTKGRYKITEKGKQILKKS